MADSVGVGNNYIRGPVRVNIIMAWRLRAMGNGMRLFSQLASVATSTK